MTFSPSSVEKTLIATATANLAVFILCTAGSTIGILAEYFLPKASATSLMRIEASSVIKISSGFLVQAHKTR